MNLTLSLVGANLRIVDNDNENVDYNFPMASTAIKFDNLAEEVHLFHSLSNKITFKSTDLDSPVCADFTALEVLINGYVSAAAQVVAGKLIKVLDSFTTAAGATAYSTGDIITSGASSAQRWLNVGCNSGYLVGLNLEFEVSATLTTPGTLPNVNIRFFNETDASLNKADNSPREVVWANNSRRLGSIALGALAADVVAGVGRIHVNTDDIRFPFAGLTDGKLYYSIEVTNTPTLGIAGFGRPASIRGKIDQNV